MNQRADGIQPDCETATGCLIPALSEDGQRILTLRGMRISLKNLIDPGTICRAFEREYGELDWFDLEMLAAIETELQPEDSDHGERR